VPRSAPVMKKRLIADEEGIYYLECDEDAEGRYHGPAKWWQIDADNAPVFLWREGTYNHGMLHGTMREYMGEGLLKEERTYVDGLVEGYYALYDDAGDLHVECTFHKGVLDGYFKVWADVSRGLLLEKAFCKNDKPVYKYAFNNHGQMTDEYYYDDDGQCVEEVTYKREKNHCYISRKSSGTYKEDVYA
jgi:antitoxin component YwqK of YwqJK toxin-antitoxin module